MSPAVLYNTVVRLLLPLLGSGILFFCLSDLFSLKKSTPYAKLTAPSPDGNGRLQEWPLSSGELLIGSHGSCDICLPEEGVLRRHVVLALEEGQFRLMPVKKNAHLQVNGNALTPQTRLGPGDTLTVGSTVLRLQPLSSKPTDKSPRRPHTILTLLLLTLFQLLIAGSLWFHYADNRDAFQIPLLFGAAAALPWLILAVTRGTLRPGFEIMGFFLTTLGLAVAATVRLSSLLKQSFCFFIGFLGFFVLTKILRHLKLTLTLRYVIGLLALALFAANLLFGTVIYGARNWLSVGPVSFQPSELIKAAFIFVCAVPLDHMLSTRNYVLFLMFSALCLGALALMRDFGTAAVYFAVMMIILSMRLTDVKTMLALVLTAGAGIGAVIAMLPYVTKRFAAYGHAWELAAGAGYQQTRTMIAIASGGLFGLGGGNSHLVRVAAADTDLVFGLVSEEWGLIVALLALICFLAMAVYTAVCVENTRSAYYAIAACGVSGLFLFQTALNMFGSVDLLPLTGVTMPFVSNGGTSMIASWLMLAFLQAARTQTVRTALARPAAPTHTRTRKGVSS